MTESQSGLCIKQQMDQDSLLSTLSSLAGQGVKRTKTGQLRELLPQIEQAQSAGYSNEAIARALTERGLVVTKKTLETMLYRIRKDAAQPAMPPPPASHAPASAPTSATPAAPPLATQTAVRITNPAQIRQARSKPVDLDDYLTPPSSSKDE